MMVATKRTTVSAVNAQVSRLMVMDERTVNEANLF
jgi:hypothetical protein